MNKILIIDTVIRFFENKNVLLNKSTQVQSNLIEEYNNLSSFGAKLYNPLKELNV